jgi:excisionase family DNA binding protein
MEKERYLSSDEVFEITGVKKQTLANSRHRGVGIPYYKVGRSVRYKLSDVLNFMEQHRVDPESHK